MNGHETRRADSVALSLAKQRTHPRGFPGEKLRVFDVMDEWLTRNTMEIFFFGCLHETERSRKKNEKRKLINGCRHEFKSVYDFFPRLLRIVYIHFEWRFSRFASFALQMNSVWLEKHPGEANCCAYTTGTAVPVGCGLTSTPYPLPVWREEYLSGIENSTENHDNFSAVQRCTVCHCQLSRFSESGPE